MQSDFYANEQKRGCCPLALLPELIAPFGCPLRAPGLGYEFCLRTAYGSAGRHGFTVERNCCGPPLPHAAVYDSRKPGAACGLSGGI